MSRFSTEETDRDRGGEAGAGAGAQGAGAIYLFFQRGEDRLWRRRPRRRCAGGGRPTRVELLDDGRGRGGPHFLGTPLLLSGKRLVGIYLQLVVSVLAFLMSSLSASLVYFLKTQRMDGMYLCRDVSHDNLQHALVLLSFRS